MDLLELIERTRSLEGGLEPFFVFLPDRGSRERLVHLVARRVVPVRRARVHGACDAVTVGRGPSSDVKVTTRGVSSLHAFLRPLGDGRWEILDNASTNGTYVDGKRLAPGRPVVLRPGAVVRFGPRRFLFGSLELCRFLRAFLERRARSFVNDPSAETMALPDDEPVEIFDSGPYALAR